MKELESKVAKGKKSLKNVCLRRGSRRTPKGMREVRRISGERKEKRKEWLEGFVEVEARESDISYVSRMEGVGKLIVVEEELKKIEENH